MACISDPKLIAVSKCIDDSHFHGVILVPSSFVREYNGTNILLNGYLCKLRLLSGQL